MPLQSFTTPRDLLKPIGPQKNNPMASTTTILHARLTIKSTRVTSQLYLENRWPTIVSNLHNGLQHLRCSPVSNIASQFLQCTTLPERLFLHKVHHYPPAVGWVGILCTKNGTIYAAHLICSSMWIFHSITVNDLYLFHMTAILLIFFATYQFCTLDLAVAPPTSVNKLQHFQGLTTGRSQQPLVNASTHCHLLRYCNTP